MVSHTTALFLAAVFVSAYGLPADSTLVSTPAVMGGAYPQASAPAVAVPVAVMQDTGAAPAAANATLPIDMDYGGQSVDLDRHRRRRRHGRESSWDRRGRSRTRRDSDDSACSDADSAASDRSLSRHSSISGRRSDSCDSVDSYRSRRCRSDSCDSRSGRSTSRGSRSDSCDSRSSRSMSRDSRSQSCDSDCDRDDWYGRRGRRGRLGRRLGRGRCRRGFWAPRPWGPRPWGPRPWGPRPRKPIRPLPIRPSHGKDVDSDCENKLERRFFDDRADVDRLSGFARMFGRGYPGQPGRRGANPTGVDAYGQNRPAGDYSRGSYGEDDVYGRRDYGHDDYRNDYGQADNYGQNNAYGLKDGDGFAGRPPPRPRRANPAQGQRTLNVDRKFSQNDYDANMSQRTVNVNDRRSGRFSLDERHADEQSFDRSGRERVMVDRFGQRVTSRQEEIDAAQREADSRRVHRSGPNGTFNSVKQSGSEDLFSSDRHERTFNGPNRRASERSFSTSTGSRDFSSESTRTVGRPSFRP